MTDLNQSGQVVSPSIDDVRRAADNLVGGILNNVADDNFINEARLAQQRDTACVACGHDPYANTKSPLQQFLSAFLSDTGKRYMANVLSGIAFLVANSYLLPSDAWTTVTSGIISMFMLLPSIAMFIALWTTLFAANALENTSNILLMIERERIYFVWNILVAGSFVALLLVAGVTEFASWVLNIIGGEL
jgi:hypothetical protein